MPRVSNNESVGTIVMTVLHSGSNNKYSANWTKAFKRGKSAMPAKPSATKAKKSAKKKVVRLVRLPTGRASLLLSRGPRTARQEPRPPDFSLWFGGRDMKLHVRYCSA